MEENRQPKRLLLVANVVKEHVLKFHIPTISFLKKKGFVVDVAAYGNDVVPFCDHQIAAQWRRSPFTRRTFLGIRQLQKIIEEGHYDIVYCHTPVGALVARLAARKARKHGTKVVYFAHGFHFFKGAPLINWLLFYPVERVLAHHTDLLITLNEEDEARAKRRFPKNLPVRRVPGVGVNFARLNVQDRAELRRVFRMVWQIPQDATVLVYVAELIRNKNQGMLFETLKELLQTRPNTYLVLVGPDQANFAFQRMAQKMGVADHVVFTGWRSDIGSCLCAADVAVASSKREGLALNIVEAMYCGLPVVATDNRGHRPIIRDGENGFLVPIDDSHAMATRIGELLDDPELYARFASCDVKQFSAETVAEQIYEILMHV